MTNLKSIACAALALCVVALPLAAEAQGRGGGQGRGGMMMGGGNMMQGPGMLLARKDVHKDLNLSTDQTTKLEALQKEYRDKLMAMFEGMRGQGGQGGQGGERPDFTTIQKDMEKMSTDLNEKSLALIDDAQKARLGQIELQMKGNRAIMEEKTQKELGFSTAQRRQVEDLEKAMNDANQAIFARAQNGEIDRTEIRPLMEENNRILDGELVKVLTGEQKTKFESMKGPKFERDPKVDEEMRNMMGRGGRGGGN